MLRLTTTAVTATRSWLENVERASDTPVTATFGASPPVIETGVTLRPVGQTSAFLAAPSTSLKVADEHHLAARQ